MRIGGCGSAQRLWAVEDTRGPQVVAIEGRLGAVLALPGLAHEAERVLEHRGSGRAARGRGSPGRRLLLVPRRPDAEPGTAAAQHVERRGGLQPEPGLAVVDAADHEAEARALRQCGHVAERRDSPRASVLPHGRRFGSGRSGP